MDAVSAALRAQFWKSHLLLPETPRTGDKAVVAKQHSCGPAAQETGLLVRVRNPPVFAAVHCEHCGQEVEDWISEVELIDDLGRPIPNGVYGYPIKWLQRVLPLTHQDASHKQVAVLATAG